MCTSNFVPPLLFGTLLVLSASRAWTASPEALEQREITVQEAEALLTSALPKSSTELPKFGIEFGKEASTPRFYALSALWSGEGAVSVMIGNYWVDRKTGDVWNAAICQELTSSALVELKHKIWQQIGLSVDGYKKLRVIGPMCSKGAE
jgi:hypothetical protein